MINITVLASGSASNCYHISDGKGSLILEMGLPYKKFVHKMAHKHLSVVGVQGYLLTHEHKDHARGAMDVLSFGGAVYTSQGTKSALSSDIGQSRAELIEVIQPLVPFFIDNWQILPFPSVHDAQEPLSFLIKSKTTGDVILFVTDSSFVSYNFSEPLNYIICECNFCESLIKKEYLSQEKSKSGLAKRIFENHMGLDTLSTLLKDNDISNLQQLVVCHISNTRADRQLIKKELSKLTPAEIIIAN